MKLLKHAQTIRNVKNDPIGFIVDSLIRIVAHLFIPIPLAGEVVVALKGPILGCLVSFILMGLFMIVTIGVIIFSPFLATESFLDKLLSPFTNSNTHIPSDGTFVQTDTPMQIPFGGHGLEFASITAGFHDPAYFLKFGADHTGIDLVPNDTYFQNNESYKINHQVVIYATMTGTANYYVDENGGLTVEDVNLQGAIKVIEIHMKKVFVKTGDSLKAGTPVGIMGQTGKATGEHVHYEIRTKQAGKWVPVNPLIYIK